MTIRMYVWWVVYVAVCPRLNNLSEYKQILTLLMGLQSTLSGVCTTLLEYVTQLFPRVHACLSC